MDSKWTVSETSLMTCCWSNTTFSTEGVLLLWTTRIEALDPGARDKILKAPAPWTFAPEPLLSLHVLNPRPEPRIPILADRPALSTIVYCAAGDLLGVKPRVEALLREIGLQPLGKASSVFAGVGNEDAQWFGRGHRCRVSCLQARLAGGLKRQRLRTGSKAA